MRRRLCPKPGNGGKKIHPSPVEDPIRAAFRLLPAAILVLVAGLGPEDQEVLAYLVTRPIQGDAGRGGRRGPAAWSVGRHPPTHGCGCFECYVSFWSRWDRSPERDRILDAVQAFEEHLAAVAAPPPSSRRRDRGGRPATPPPARLPETLEPLAVEVVREPAAPLPPSCPPPTPASCAAESTEEDNAAPEPPARAQPEDSKRGWADVLGGVLGLRLWGIWSPAVGSAT